jgi:hypothetical protein
MFTQKLDELRELHELKSQDYASDEDPYRNFKENAKLWGRLAWVEPLIRLSEKVFRLINLIVNKKTPNNEGIRDSIKDIACLAIIALDMFDERLTLGELHDTQNSKK